MFINACLLCTVGSNILLEFLEVAFNHILFHRNLYPKEIFAKKKIYSTTVYISQHPELNEYLRNVLNTIKELVKEDENSIKAVNLVFYNKKKEPIEKFVFDLVQFQANSTEYVYYCMILYSMKLMYDKFILGKTPII